MNAVSQEGRMPGQAVFSDENEAGLVGAEVVFDEGHCRTTNSGTAALKEDAAEWMMRTA
jgi:hypothetical protein